MRSPATASTAAAIARRGLADGEHDQARRVRQRFSGEAQARPVAARARAAPRRPRPRPRAPRGSSVRAGPGRRRPGSRRGAGLRRQRASPAASRPRVPAAIGSSVISIRRFFWRPSGVSFEAIGSYSPCDTEISRWGSILCSARKRTTPLARAPASSQFDGKRAARAPRIGTESVCPRTSMRWGTSCRRCATLRSTERPASLSSAEPDANSTSCVRFSCRPSRSCWISI